MYFALVALLFIIEKSLIMNFLGIDYGTKRIGVAVAREGSTLATPLTVLDVAGKSPKSIAEIVATIVRTEKIGTVVVGESKDFSGIDNLVMKKARVFVSVLAALLGETILIVFEPEFFTTRQAERIQGDHPLIDASAAALILQSYLNR